MFIHIFVNRFKVLLRKKSMIFWTLIFPIVLATFFNMAFAELFSDEKFEAFDIAVVINDEFENEENFKMLLNSVSKEDENKIFNIEYVIKENGAKELLENNEIKGYIIINDKIEIVTKSNGIEQTIMKNVVDSYYQTYNIIENIAKVNPELLMNGLIDEIHEENNYFKDISNENVDFTVVYFYTLIGMTCMYAAFFGIEAVNESEANLSKRGARLSVSPTHKLKALLSSLLVSFIIQYIEILILLAYLIFVLGIDFGNQVGYILLLTFVGSLAGISLGVLVGSSMKKGIGAKTAVVLSITMTCSFLAGMMVWTMKYIVEQNFPIVNRINPVAMITDGLYSLYYYDNFDRYFYNIGSLLIFSVVMIGVSYIFIRRKKYDSI